MRKEFNVRVYGFLVNAANEVLLSDEMAAGLAFTKFPGGGLQYGESLPEALKREFEEECQVQIEQLKHIYTTDIFVASFVDQSQVIGVYYEVQLKDDQHIFQNSSDKALKGIRYVPFQDVANLLTFELDQRAWSHYYRHYLQKLNPTI